MNVNSIKSADEEYKKKEVKRWKMEEESSSEHLNKNK